MKKGKTKDFYCPQIPQITTDYKKSALVSGAHHGI